MSVILSLGHLMFAVDVLEAPSAHALPLLLPLAHNILPKLEPQLCLSPQVVAQQGCQHPMEDGEPAAPGGRGLTTGRALRGRATSEHPAKAKGSLGPQ